MRSRKVTNRVYFLLLCFLPLVDTAALSAPLPAQLRSNSELLLVTLGYGAQSILPQGQPVNPESFFRLYVPFDGIGVDIKLSGIERVPWGSLSVVIPVLGNREDTFFFSTELLSPLNSRAMSISPWFGIQAGGRSFAFQWYTGVQLGLFTSPMPNQRPLGPQFLGNLSGVISYEFLDHFFITLEAETSMKAGHLLAAMRHDFGKKWKVQVGIPVIFSLTPGFEKMAVSFPAMCITYGQVKE